MRLRKKSVRLLAAGGKEKTRTVILVFRSNLDGESLVADCVSRTRVTLGPVKLSDLMGRIDLKVVVDRKYHYDSRRESRPNRIHDRVWSPLSSCGSGREKQPAPEARVDHVVGRMPVFDLDQKVDEIHVSVRMGGSSRNK